mmetsp:Transcript_53218/g.116541  ORF Transcript_53218/g.116541 Transcript_53218/m.116541 type:complete len:449 (-) Transcript_53218:1141-2487(-)
MLQALAIQGGAACRRAKEESPGTGIGALPDHVTNTLEAEHGVVDEEGQHGAPLGSIGGACGDPSAQSTRLADALLQDLPIRSLGVLHHDVMVDRCVMLPEGRMDLELVEERVQAEGARLVGDHGHAPLPEILELHQLPQQGREAHGRAHRLGVALVEDREGLCGRQRYEVADLRGRPQGERASQCFPAFHHVADLRRLHAGVPEKLAALRVRNLLISERDVQEVPEGQHLFHLQRLLLMHRVPAQEGRQGEPLQCLCEDHRRPPATLRVVLCLREGGVDLLMVMSAWQAEGGVELLIRQMGDSVQEAVCLEELLPDESPVALGCVALAVAVRASLQDLDELAIVVVVDEVVEHLAPDELDAIEPCAPEDAFELLDNLRVPTHWAIKPLIVAVDDHDQVIEPFVARPGNGIDGFGFVHLTIADEAPDAAARSVRKAPQVEVAEEARLGH